VEEVEKNGGPSPHAILTRTTRSRRVPIDVERETARPVRMVPYRTRGEGGDEKAVSRGPFVSLLALYCLNPRS